MLLLRSVTRWVPRYNRFTEPCAQSVEVRLMQGNADGNPVVIVTPWACLSATADATDSQLCAALGCSFDTADEALAEANRRAPFFHRAENQTVNGRLDDAIRWDGSIVGPGRLADQIGCSVDRLYRLASGIEKATRAEAKAAREYTGRRV